MYSFKIFFTSVLLFTGIALFSQITTDPALPNDTDEVLITFDATGTGLDGYTGNVYAHTGVTIEDVGQWQYVIGPWGNNDVEPKLTRIAANLYELSISPSIREFYDVPDEEVITQMCFVFRSADASQQTSPDIFIDVYLEGLNVSIISPPKNKPIVEFESTLEIKAVATFADELTLLINNVEAGNTTDDEIVHEFYADTYGTFRIKAVASDNTNEVADSTYIFVRPDPEIAELPVNVIPGANYINETTVTLVLHDPPALKEYVFAIGNFNDWMTNDESYMKRTPDGKHYWITIEGLTPDTEYGYQYFIDNKLRLADPYTHKVLDPWNDKYISQHNYPGLKTYPDDKTTGYVSIIHPGMPEYEWEVTDYTPPDPGNLVIYELLIRDFVETSAIKTVTDSLDYLQKLGVNAIELMPINQFEGNISWGYNPALYFATDKAYGTMNDYKKFIDECHKRGIAVIIDIVLNHSFNMSPMVQMYFDPDAGSWGKPLPENPWFLVDCPHEPWCWGNTFDQNSTYTHDFFNRVTEYWLTEFNVDGFRFDFTKGFTNVQTGGQGWNYDQARINNLKRIYNHIISINPDAYVILEHFTENAEEKELAENGMLIWGNMNHSYNEATMGWLNDSNFSWISHKERGWSEPHLIGYMESHDEERLMYKNLKWGNDSNPNHNIKNLETALKRNELAAVFFLTIPGPKMIWQFGELGYEYSINHCEDGTIDEGCRTAPKPIRWDYYDNWDRRNLYYVYSALNKLRREHNVFRTDDFSLYLGGAVKRIHLNHAHNKVTVIGNFDVNEQEATPHFQQTGTWYEFFSREELQVDDVTQTIILQPGEYRLYSTAEFPDHGFNLNIEDLNRQNPYNINVYPNPSSTGFYFEFDIKQGPSAGKLEIINLQGQTVFAQNIQLGANEMFYWNGKASNEKVSQGVYLYRINFDDSQLSGRLIVK